MLETNGDEDFYLQIIDNTGHTFYLIANGARNLHKKGVVEVEHLRAHEIFGTNSAENHNVTPNSLITKNTNTTASIETSKGLSYLVVKAGLLDHGDEDVVGLAGDLYSLLGNVAEYANGDTSRGRAADLLATGVCRAVDQLPALHL